MRKDRLLAFVQTGTHYAPLFRDKDGNEYRGAPILAGRAACEDYCRSYYGDTRESDNVRRAS